MSSTVTSTKPYRLTSTDRIKLTNLIPSKENGSRNNYCSSCGSYSCENVGEPNHWSPVSHPSPNSFLKGIENWELKGRMCLNFGGSMIFHVEISLAQGNNLEVVGLSLALSPCSSQKNTNGRCNSSNQQISTLLEDIEITIAFTSSDTEYKKFMTIPFGESWESGLKNDFFLPMEVFRALCKKGHNPQSGTTEEFEYVDALIQVDCIFYPTKTFWPAACTTKFQQGKIDMQISSVEEANETSMSVESIPPLPSTLGETVVFKLGKDLKDSVAIHKNILKSRSEVFKRMFETEMTEGASNTVEIPEVDSETMTAFAKCLYCKKLPNDLTTTLEVLKLAHKYLIEDIIKAATRSIVMSTDYESMDLVMALNVFAAGNRLNITDLEFRALQWLRSNRPSVSTTAGREIINDFLQQNMDILPAFLSCFPYFHPSV
ncbi:unnamed protein product [Allacma fusca]|uniref:BTB domain-containing protein n=1 Tax=Allacma fusca TaxID=39272 RepID=A0A8J2KZT3_9HEXA|nr:unnamed protein product [Allacma fusca]